MTLFGSVLGAVWYISAELADLKADVRWIKDTRIRDAKDVPTKHDLQNGFVSLAMAQQKQLNGILTISDNFDKLVTNITSHDNLRAGR